MARIKKILFSLLRIAFSVLLLFILFKSKEINLNELVAGIHRADKALLFVGFCIYFFINILGLLRWEMLLKATRIHLPLKRVIISYAGGMFFSLILPSTIGGDLTRSIDLSLHTKRPEEVVATVFVDRLSGYVGLVILVLISVFLGWRYVRDNSFILFSVMIISLLLATVLLVIFNRRVYTKINKLLHSPSAGRIRNAIRRMHQEVYIFRDRKKVLAQNVALSLLIQSIGPLTLYLICLALGQKINFIYFLIFIPIICAITLIPISIGGLGVRESLTVHLFGYVGLSKNIAAAMALINFSFILACGIIGGLVYVFTVHNRRIQHRQPRTY
ncbi:MAG: flippase-like domain-containing protein [Candidatus Omnitrophica bacterium]|nr:flippase-like domain-containing protein [Candidatus Omnitrophota bacterium]